jgi:hypothetical protein
LPSYNTETLQNIYDVIDASSLDPQLFGALIEQEEIFLFFTVDAKEPSAKFTQGLFFAIVFGVVRVEETAVSNPIEGHGTVHT